MKESFLDYFEGGRTGVEERLYSAVQRALEECEDDALGDIRRILRLREMPESIADDIKKGKRIRGRALMELAAGLPVNLLKIFGQVTISDSEIGELRVRMNSDGSFARIGHGPNPMPEEGQRYHYISSKARVELLESEL